MGLAALLLLSAGLRASQIHYKDVTLAALLQRDPIIAVVEGAEPATRRATLPAGAEASLVRLRVVSVVQAPEGLLSPGQVVEVAGANLEAMLHLRQREQHDGVRISPIFERLQAAPPEGPQRIVLLRPCQAAGASLLCFLVDGAQVSTELLPAITAAIAEGSPAP